MPDELEVFTVGIYDVNGDPFTTEVTDDDWAELNAQSSRYNWVKTSHTRGKRMYYGNHLITPAETRKNA